jgi:molecular chaperone DnaK (HSP70)
MILARGVVLPVSPRFRNFCKTSSMEKKLNKSVHPNEAVDYGAVVQADILSGDKSENGQTALSCHSFFPRY